MTEQFMRGMENIHRAMEQFMTDPSGVEITFRFKYPSTASSFLHALQREERRNYMYAHADWRMQPHASWLLPEANVELSPIRAERALQLVDHAGYGAARLTVFGHKVKINSYKHFGELNHRGELIL